MSKTILIVESDAALTRKARRLLESRDFEVEETADGKGAPELIRSRRPDLVMLAVDLSAGQNGYLICSKLKKDDELKNVPVVIVGNPDGFAQHRKLKAHADDYLAKPLAEDALFKCLGALIGLPEPEAAGGGEEDLSELGDDGQYPRTTENERPGEAPDNGAMREDSDLEMLDSAFDGSHSGPQEISMSQVVEEISSTESPVAPPAPPGPPSSAKLERELSALRGASAQKDAEIRQLQSDLEQKEKDLLEVQEQHKQLEQATTQSSGEMARRDWQVKTLSSRVDQLTAERKKIDQELLEAREEARAATARSATLRADLDQAQGRLAAREVELETTIQAAKAEADEMVRQLQTTRTEAAERGESLEAAKHQLTTQAVAFAEEAASLRKKVTELEGAAGKVNQRIAKLAARIKSDEKLREKTKKALSIALQLLEEQPPVDDEALA